MINIHDPILFDRSLMSWLNFLICIPILMLAINTQTVWVKCVDFLIIGMNFTFFLTEPIVKSGWRIAKVLAQRTDKMQAEMLKALGAKHEKGK